MTEAPRIIRSSTPLRQFDNIGEMTAVAVFPDGRRMATNSLDGMLRVWDLKNGVILKGMDGHGDAMQDMALSRDGQLIASSDESGYVTTWHGDTYRPVTQAFRAHSTACPLDFSPDGTTLVTGSFEGCKLWNTKTWQLQGESFGSSFGYGIHCIRYSPSGELLAITANNAIEIW